MLAAVYDIKSRTMRDNHDIARKAIIKFDNLEFHLICLIHYNYILYLF